MDRQSPLHYINPSDINLVPNANSPVDGVYNDIAVYVAKDTKIKVCCPRVGLGNTNGQYQEWTLEGKNRRLELSDRPYTIYARIHKSDRSDGYVMFIPKIKDREIWPDNEWHDAQAYLMLNADHGTSSGFLDFYYWWVKLGEVSLPDANTGERTLTFDTGILGTEQFNTEWALNPDALPLSINLSNIITSPDGTTRDGGPTPYVYWGESLTLNAMLTEGWTGTDVRRFDHWEVQRDSGNTEADAAWNEERNADNDNAFRTTGVITLQHGRGQGSVDDFNGAVNTTFTVNAIERHNLAKPAGATGTAQLVSGTNYTIGGTHSEAAGWAKFNGDVVVPTVCDGVCTFIPDEDGTLEILGCDDTSCVVESLAEMPTNLLSLSVNSCAALLSAGVTYIISGMHSTTGEWWAKFNGEDVYPQQIGNRKYLFTPSENGTLVLLGCDATTNVRDSESPLYSILKSASIDIMAETWETYALSLSSSMVTYNPIAKSYTPNNGISFTFRATDQRSQTFMFTNKQVSDAGLVAEYSVVDASPEIWTAITVSGQDDDVAIGGLDISVFSTNQQSINLRLRNSANTELFRATIAFLRDGEDSKEREWIFLRSATEITFGTAEHPYPADIAQGEVNPAGEASGTDIDKNQDGWVPNGWLDEQQGVDATNRYEYGAYRDFVHESNGVTAHWGAFTEPRIWNHWGEDGDDGLYYVDDYRRYDSRSANATTGAPAGNTDMQGWAETAPAPTETYKYIWKRSRQYNPNTQQFVGNPIYVCLTGERGVDAQDIEWAFIRTKTDTAPVILSDSTYVDSNSHDYTDDDHLPHVSGNSNVENNEGTYECTDDPKGVDDTWKFEWEIKREKADADSDGKRAWNYYQGTMTLHNNYAESAFIVDTDNDGDQFGTDSASKVLNQQVRETNVTMLYGTQAQDFTAAPTATLKYDDGTPSTGNVDSSVATVTVTKVTNSKYNIKVTVKRTPDGTTVMPLASHNGLYVDISCTCARGTKVVRFTLEKVMGGAPGVSPTIYQLNPTSKDFVFNRDASNSLTPATRSTTVNALKSNANGTVDATQADGLTFTWGFDDSATSQGSGSVGDSSGTPPHNQISITNTLAASHYQVWIQLSSGDRETLPIVKDGQKGDNGIDAQYIYLKGTARDVDGSIITTVQNETSVTGGSNTALHSRGLNLVTVNRQTMAVVESLNYDTYLEGRGDAGATGITDLVAKLNTLDDTVFVCLTSFDAIGWNDALISALQSYGMGDLPYTQIGRYPFLFIGYKNLGKGNGLTRMRNVGHYYDVVELSAYMAGGALTVKDGKDGVNGADGGNTATVMLYKRSASAVTSVGISATLYYKFATKKLYTDAACTTEATTQLNGWNLSIPSGADPIYATSAVAYSTEDHDSIGSTEWVTPVQFTDNGKNGISTAVVLLYKRSATTVTAHGITATLYYKFADGKLYIKSGSTYTEATSADLNNWQRDIPASDGNPCYAIQAAALGTGDYDSVVPADWSGATKIVEDGADGQDMRENLIDHSRPSYEVDLSDESQRWQTYTDNDLRYITDKVFDPAVIPDGTPLSGQMRLTLSGCTYASDATVGIYMSGVNRWPFIARQAPVSADGTYIVKIENFTIASDHGAWDGKVYLQVKGCGTSGTVSVSHVKLEVGEKCSGWCLSENDKKGQQGPKGAAGGPSKVYRKLTAGCLYFCASDGAAERVGVLNSQDYIAVRAKEGDGYDSGWIMYRCTESFLATDAAIADLNEAIADYEGGGETTKSQIDAAMAASSLTPQPSGIPLGKGAFAEIATNQTAAFFTQLVAKNANIEVLTGAQYYIVDENNITAGGFGKVDDENDGKTYMIWAGGETPSAAPYAVDSAGNVKMETGVFGGFLKNTARVITAKNVKDYVSWGKTEDWYVDSTTGTYKQRKGWILNLDKAGSNVIFFSGEAAIWGTETYGSIKLELERLASEEHANDYTDGVDYYNEIYIPLPWYANQVALSIGGETGNADWVSYAARLGHSTLVDDWAYTQPNVALQYIDSHYRVVNATSDIYDQWWKIHFAGLARLGDMGWGVGLPSFISGEACEWILLCNASSRGTGSDEAYGVWWTTVMSYGSQAAGGAHLFSAAWMYVYGLIPL